MALNLVAVISIFLIYFNPTVIIEKLSNLLRCNLRLTVFFYIQRGHTNEILAKRITAIWNAKNLNTIKSLEVYFYQNVNGADFTRSVSNR